jgi:branched-chain amino acid aminotransferase
MKDPTAFLDGRWIPASEARVSVGDAGFVLGVTVAEQLRTFGGKLFRLRAHLARLAHSLEIVGVEGDCPNFRASENGTVPFADELAAVAEELVARNHPLLAPDDDLGLSIVVTPGVYPTFAPPGPVRPTVCLHTYPLPFHLWAEKYRTGQHLATTGVRQVPSCCWPPELKCRSRMHYYLADRQAVAVDPAARALLLDAQGFVTEASTANLLIYRAAQGLISPPVKDILHGISLSAVVEIAGRLDIPFREQPLRPDDVAWAEEAILTSTSICALPVTHLDGRPIGAGRPGPAFSRLLAAWSEMVGLDIAAQAQRHARRAADRQTHAPR